MTKPKDPTNMAEDFGQAPEAGRAEVLTPSSQRHAALQWPLLTPERGELPSSADAVNAPRTPFKSQSRIYQPPEAARGDDDAMGQPQD